MSRALLIGAAGGVIGATTAAIGIIWSFIVYTFLIEINNYLIQFELYLNALFHNYQIPFPVPLPFYLSRTLSDFRPLFDLSSLILAVFLIVTGILIGIGFYGACKIGGGAMGAVGLIFSIIGITLGALLIIIGNLTTVYVDVILVGPEVPTPNFLIIWIGLIVLSVTFIILGSASINLRETVTMPSAFSAAGVLSIIGAVFFILGGQISISTNNINIVIIGFGWIFAAFIFLARGFYSSRNL